MNVYAGITGMIKRFGGDVVVIESEKRYKSKAVIQPLMYKNKMYLGGSQFPLGYYDAGHYLMIAPSDFPLADYQNVLISYNDNLYKIKRCEVVSAENKDIYMWAVLTTASGETEDDYENSDTVA